MNNDNLFYAIEQDNIDHLRQMLIDGYSVNVKNSNGDTPLKFALSLGRAECLQILLNYGVSPDINGKFDPLEYATFEVKDARCMDILLEYGAYSDDVNKKISLLFRINNIECLAVMIKYVDINLFDPYRSGENLLHRSVKNGELEKTEFLLINGADVNIETRSSYEYTPLDLAYFNNSLEMIDLLLYYGADKNEIIRKFSSYPYFKIPESTRRHIIEYDDLRIKEPDF